MSFDKFGKFGNRQSDAPVYNPFGENNPSYIPPSVGGGGIGYDNNPIGSGNGQQYTVNNTPNNLPPTDAELGLCAKVVNGQVVYVPCGEIVINTKTINENPCLNGKQLYGGANCNEVVNSPTATKNFDIKDLILNNQGIAIGAAVILVYFIFKGK